MEEIIVVQALLQILDYIVGAMNALVILGMTAETAYWVICGLLGLDKYTEDND